MEAGTWTIDWTTSGADQVTTSEATAQMESEATGCFSTPKQQKRHAAGLAPMQRSAFEPAVVPEATPLTGLHEPSHANATEAIAPIPEAVGISAQCALWTYGRPAALCTSTAPALGTSTQARNPPASPPVQSAPPASEPPAWAPASAPGAPALDWVKFAVALGVTVPWMQSPTNWSAGITVNALSFSLRRVIPYHIGVFDSNESATSCARRLLQSLKVSANQKCSISELITRACAGQGELPPASNHHSSYSIQHRSSDTFSLSANVSRTWGRYGSKEMAGFAAALLLAGVPDYDISNKLEAARTRLDMGSAGRLHLHSSIARPPSVEVTLPPLQPVPVGTRSPAAAEPVAPDHGALQVLAPSTPCPAIANRASGLAAPEAWVRILSGLSRSYEVQLSENTVDQIAGWMADLSTKPGRLWRARRPTGRLGRLPRHRRRRQPWHAPPCRRQQEGAARRPALRLDRRPAAAAELAAARRRLAMRPLRPRRGRPGRRARLRPQTPARRG